MSNHASRIESQPPRRHLRPQPDAEFQPEPRYYPEDEISLYDLWNVLVRRRLVIAAVLMLILAAGGTHAVLKPVTYEYRSGIEIAHVYRGEEASGDRYRHIESADAAQASLNDLVIPSIRRDLAGGEASPPRVRVQVRSASNSLLLLSTAEPAQAEEVARLHTAIAEGLAERHRPALERELALVLQQLQVQAEVLRAEVAADREQIEFIQEREHAEAGEAGVVALIDAQRLADLRRNLTETQGQLARVESNITAVEQASRPTTVSFLASQSEEPVGTGRSLIIALSLVLGLMAGIFAAFLWEFIGNARQQRQA